MADYATSSPELSPMEEQDIFLRIQKWYRDSEQGSATWRKEARENYDFVAGDQYEEKDRKNLKDLLRPCLTFNRIGPIVDAVSGMEVNNRQEVRYIPRTEGDEQVNEVLTGAAQWVRDECDAEDEESDAFIDLIICGMGWTETRIEYETDPEGVVRIERVDPLEMFWDRSATRRNLDGARYFCRVKEIDLSDARAMFPDIPDESLHAAWTTPAQEESGSVDRVKASQYEDGQKLESARMGKVRIVEAQWWELEAYWRVLNPLSGQIEEVNEKDYSKAVKKLELVVEQAKGAALEMAAAQGQPAPEINTEIKAVKSKRRVYKRAFVGAKVLEAGPGPCKGSFTYRPMTGKRDRNKVEWYGLVRAMKDPQKYANKLMSAILHLIATAGKGVMVETDAVDDPRNFEKDWAHPDAAIWARPGALANGKIQPKFANPLPPGLPEMMMQSIQGVRDVAGVNLEFIAAADNAQSGVLEYQRKQAAMTTLASIFDALRRYRKEQGRVLLYFIQEYLTDGRLVRIVGKEKTQYVQLTKDEQVLKYDVIVDQAPTSPNQKEATWALLKEMIPTMMKVGMPPQMWMEVIKTSPLPSSFAQSFQKAIEEQQNKPPPEDPEITKMKMGAEIDAQKMQADAAHKEKLVQLEQQKAGAQIQMQREKNAADIQLAREKNEADIQLEWAKANANADIERFKAGQQAEIQAQQADQQAQIDRESAEQGFVIAKDKANNDMKIKRKMAAARPVGSK